jgi:hypothetical protein
VGHAFCNQRGQKATQIFVISTPGERRNTLVLAVHEGHKEGHEKETASILPLILP